MQRKITDYLKRFLIKNARFKKNANFMKIVEALLQLLFISGDIKSN